MNEKWVRVPMLTQHQSITERHHLVTLHYGLFWPIMGPLLARLSCYD